MVLKIVSGVFSLLLAAGQAFATEAMVIETSANVLGHGAGMRNTLISESGLAAANVKICYTSSSDIDGHDPAIHIRATGHWPDACVQYAHDNDYEVTSISYDWWFGRQADEVLKSAADGHVAVITAATENPIDGRLYYTTTPGLEYPDDSAASINSTLLEFRTYDSGSLSSATARTAGIIAYLIDQRGFNYFDARAAIRENSSNWPNWDNTAGFGYVDITAAKAETTAANLSLQPPMITAISPIYDASGSKIVVTFNNYLQTRWDSTKIVYFSSAPVGTEGPGDATAIICDNTSPTTTTCASGYVADGTYYVSAYTEDGASYSPLINGLTTYPITIDYSYSGSERGPANTFLDNSSENIVHDGLSWATAWETLDQVNVVDGDSLYIKASETPYNNEDDFYDPAVIIFPASFTVYGDATGVGTERGNGKAIIQVAKEFSLADFTYDAVHGTYYRAYEAPYEAYGYVQNADNSGLPEFLMNQTDAATLYAASMGMVSNVTDGMIIKLGSINDSNVRIFIPKSMASYIPASYITHMYNVQTQYCAYGFQIRTLAQGVDSFFSVDNILQSGGAGSFEYSKFLYAPGINAVAFLFSTGTGSGTYTYKGNVIAHLLQEAYGVTGSSCVYVYSSDTTLPVATLVLTGNTLYDCDISLKTSISSSRYGILSTNNNIFNDGISYLIFGTLTQTNDYNAYTSYTGYTPGPHDVLNSDLKLLPDGRLSQDSPARKKASTLKFNNLPADIGAYQTSEGVVGSDIYYSPGYPLGSTFNTVTTP